MNARVHAWAAFTAEINVQAYHERGTLCRKTLALPRKGRNAPGEKARQRGQETVCLSKKDCDKSKFGGTSGSNRESHGGNGKDSGKRCWHYGKIGKVSKDCWSTRNVGRSQRRKH